MNLSDSSTYGGVWIARERTWGGPALFLKVDHGITDEKGRHVGGAAEVWQVRDSSAYHGELVGQWGLIVQATRDRARYGASPRATYWPTEWAARQAGEAKLTAQRKAYARKYRTAEVYEQLDPRDAAEPHSALDLDDEGVGL